mmetsp:Transcript_20986/g.59886  ORF Transcript_20986/g.59886 Transcript_20986/m.59886 type:complete len:109 (-) Transcript_20986:659-985(-)
MARARTHRKDFRRDGTKEAEAQVEVAVTVEVAGTAEMIAAAAVAASKTKRNVMAETRNLRYAKHRLALIIIARSICTLRFFDAIVHFTIVLKPIGISYVSSNRCITNI